MLPNAPYVFTRCSGSTPAFITCPADSLFVGGARLSSATPAATTYRVICNAVDEATSAGACTGSHRSHASLTSGMQRTIVSQFSHDRFPDTISVSWNRIVMMPAMDAIGCGAKYANGTASSTTWLIATPAACTPCGIQWKYQLSGFGIGCVSK